MLQWFISETRKTSIFWQHSGHEHITSLHESSSPPPPHSLSILASFPHLSRITVISSSWWRPRHRPHPYYPLEGLRPRVGWHPLPDVGREPVHTCSVWVRAWSWHTDSASVQQYEYFSSFVAPCWLKSITKQGKLNVVPALCTQV